MRQKHEEIRWGVFTQRDVDIMRSAFHLAMDDGTSLDVAEDGEMLGRTIIRLYKMGLVDPQKLASVAALMTSSKLLRSATARRCRSAGETLSG